MLRSLHIRNYVLIEALDIDFPEGLVIITGQTGAGKSILLGALSLVSGGKADAGAISQGQDSCVVEAEFDIDEKSSEVKEILQREDVEWDGGHLIVRRTLNSSGRSRSFVNDSPVPVQVLGELSARLIDIHSQHQSLLLTDKKFQLGILDHFAGNSALLEQCHSIWQDLSDSRRKEQELSARIQALGSESEYKRAQFEKLRSAKLRPGELEELEEEQKKLANAESIKENLGAVSQIFDGDGNGLIAQLKEAEKYLRKLDGIIPAAQELANRIESSRIELDDICSSVEDTNEHISLSEERLTAVEQRMSLLYDLLKKHSCSSVEELIALRDELALSLGDSGELQEQLDELEKHIARTEAQYEQLSQELHESRKKAAIPFAKTIQDNLQYLELDRSVFEVEIVDANPGPMGKDSIQFNFSSNGTKAVDVAKCASGGEISRIMLCLKAMMARFVGMPTLIFDEIDTGVSGSVADKMGTMICEMGTHMQVFSITHLPQVAAKGKAHYVVSKTFQGEKAISSINEVRSEQRVMEIARMLSGATVTPAAVENAKALLNQ